RPLSAMPAKPRPALSSESFRAWQRMLSGRRLDLLDPSPLDVEIADIARRLARLARVSRLGILLHDAPEYVIGDMISPFKAVIGDAYKAVEARLLAAIHLRFGLPAEPDAALRRRIKQADRIAASSEATRLAGFSRQEALRFFGRPVALAAETEA